MENLINGMDIIFKTLGFTIVSFLMMCAINIVYKNKLKQGYTEVTPQFHNLMVLTLVLLLYEIVKTIAIVVIPGALEKENMIVLLLDEGYMTFGMVWVIMYITYIWGVIKYKGLKKEYNENTLRKPRRILNGIIVVISLVVSYILEFDKVITPEGNIYLIGNAPELLNFLFKIATVFVIVMLIIWRKKIHGVSLKPLIITTILYVILMSLDKFAGFHPNCLTSFFSYIMVSFFFTIESQDIQLYINYKETMERKKEIDKWKENFLSNISHELREPINSIVGYSELSIEDNKIEEEDLKNIDESIDSLGELLNNLITVGEIFNEEIKAEQNQYDKEQFYLNLKNFILTNNQKENTSFVLNQQENTFKTLYGDSKKIFKILSNIVSNAYKHTSFGQVKLDIEEKKLDSEYIEVTYTISNSGHTMTDEMFNEDFEKYLYSQNELDSHKIGLSIAKKYIEILGGSIEFINKEGQGTKYIVKLRQKNIEKQPSAAI